MGREHRIPEGTVTYSPSQQEKIKLSTNYHMNNLVCVLKVNHDNAAGATFKSEHFANLISSIQILANGSLTIKHMDANKLVFNSLFGTGKAMQNSVDKTEGTGRTSYLHFSIDFSMRNMTRPADTIENMALYKVVDMLVNWAGPSSVGTGITINSASLSVVSEGFIGYARNTQEYIKHNVEIQVSEEITSTTTRYKIDLNADKSYRRFMIASLIEGVRTNDIIKNVQLKSGVTIFMEWTAEMLRASNIERHGIVTESDVDGLLMLDFSRRGRISDFLDTRGQTFNSLELVLDVEKQAGGTNEVIVYQDYLDIEGVFEAAALKK